MLKMIGLSIKAKGIVEPSTLPRKSFPLRVTSKEQQVDWIIF